jgi:acyl-coenzyme A thioesterase PaaI-like protein
MTTTLDEAAKELRALSDLLVANDITGDDLASVVSHLRAASELLGRHEHGSLYRLLTPGAAISSAEHHASEGVAPSTSFPHAFGDHPFRRHSPVIGSSNPVAPPATLGWDGERIVGTATFGPRFEGAPGCVHGGFVAAVFDEALGMAQGITGAPGMTAYLNVQYRRPHRLGRLVRFEARMDRVEGRKIYCSGSSFDVETGDLLGEAEALFVSINWETVRAASAERPGSSDG